MNNDRWLRLGQASVAATAAAAPPGAYPAIRMRRNRRDAWTRRLVAENTLSVDDLIWPIFVIEGSNEERAVASMPGQVRVTVDRIAKHVEKAVRLGVPVYAGGLADVVKSPRYATTVGLLLEGREQFLRGQAARAQVTGIGGAAERMKNWFKANF